MVRLIQKVSVSCNVKFVMDTLRIHPKMHIFMGECKKKKKSKEKLDLFLQRIPSVSESKY